jgi:nucleoside-diphosphate-sugar epimerase
MRAFLTGGSGFIGRHLIEALLAEGWSVTALVHRSPVPDAGKVEAVNGDITDAGALAAGIKGADVVFHLASALGGSLIGRREFFRINASGTRAVLEAVRRAGGPRILHVSSAGVFGHVREGEVAGEDSPARPILAYDHAKLAGEKAAMEAATAGMDVVVVRPGWAYGPGDRRTFKLIRMVAAGPSVMATRGSARQTPVHVSDLVKGVLLAAGRGRQGEAYHLAGAEIMTADAIVRAIAAAAGRPPARVRLPGWLAQAAALVLEVACRPLRREPPLSRSKLSFFLDSKPLSIDKARRELGFRPAVDFEAGIRMTLDWYRENGWL